MSQKMSPGIPSGEEADFSALAERYYDGVYHHALALCRNPWDAADVTQNTFIKAYQRFGTLRDLRSFGRWLTRIADNEAKQLFRQNSRKTPEAPEPRQSRSMEATLGAAIDALGEGHRRIIALKYFAGLTMKEIAMLTGLPEKRVKSRLYEARRKIRLLIEEGEGERRKRIMERLDRLQLGSKVLPYLSCHAQRELLACSKEGRRFPTEVIAELSRVEAGDSWVEACDARLSYQEFMDVLACLDEPTIYRISEGNYSTWGPRARTNLILDMAKKAGTGGYVESVEAILVVPSIVDTVAWYRKHLGWDGCGSPEDDAYGYGTVFAYTGDATGNSHKAFKGFHLWKGAPATAGSAFCFVVDVEALRERILDNGWENVTEVADRGWGTKGFDCVDLNGYTLVFCEWVEQQDG